MKLTIEPTKEFFMAGEVMVRMWHGTAEDGSEVVALVTAVRFASQATASAAAVASGLVSIPPPDDAAARRWAEVIMAKAE